MRAGRALLDPTDCQGCRIEVDLIPAQVYQLACPKPVPVRHKDHGRIPMAPAIGLGRLSKPRHLSIGQVFSRAEFGILHPLRCDCSIFGVRRDQLEMRFH